LLGTRVYRYPRTYLGVLVPDEPLYAAEGGLGILRDPQRTVLRRSNEPAVLTRQLMAQAEKPQSLIVAKSNFRSRVHRRVHCDYFGVTLHDAKGRPEGEVRFLGLFTAEAYDRPTDEVPLIRSKVRRVIERLAGIPGGPAVRRLRNILENFPRDELFQATEEELGATILGIAELRDRPRVRLFARTDPFDRFASALLFVPRDRYDSAYGEKAGRLLASAYGGRVSAFYPAFGDAPLARIHYIIGLDPDDHARPDLGKVEAGLAEASLGWSDRLEAAAEAGGAGAGDLARWKAAFGAGYQEKYDAAEALADILVFEETVK
jgi:glutamate dehydrogenase